MSWVGDPGTTWVLAADFLAPSSARALLTTACFLALSLKPILARLSFWACVTSAVVA